MLNHGFVFNFGRKGIRKKYQTLPKAQNLPNHVTFAYFVPFLCIFAFWKP